MKFRYIESISITKQRLFMKRVMALSAMAFLLLSVGCLIQTPSTQIANAQTVPAVSDFNFAAVGDWGCTPNTNNTVNNIVGKNPELVLALGDYSYNTTSDDCWFKIVKPIQDKMKIAIGNHDHRGLGELYRYMSHFGLTQQYYSFNYKNIHFLALSTEIPFLVNSAQYKFVKNDLSKAASDQNIDWIIVYFHRPMYTLPSTHATISALRSMYHPLCEQYGVNLVL
jgi:hypothetical protein